ncbi:hypothetical protein [Actinopolymorpha pittospori]|uniref:GH26 domain-containing protein n=1 Tax=Actinopolymorpha pittospori TaxID=648752 RepID=A0A927RQ92_9ACTN|nr:hypothetical protein [Actinopolymorpha pittospori]MBE1611973.1 hypothetical protein [Actinopolymorpha pittospori]
MSRKLVKVLGVAFVLVLAASQAAAQSAPADSLGPAVKSTCGVGPKLVPRCGAWWGVASNPLNGETWDAALVNFETQIGRTVNISHYYQRAGERFPTPTQIKRATEPGKNRLLSINYKPEAGHTWAQVAAGATNAELDALAAYMNANFRQQFFFTVHHEPEEEVRPTPGSGYTATDYRAMYRHVILRLRSRGVNQIVTVMNYVGLPRWGSEPWFEDMYPGNDVVDWIAYDPYIFGSGAYRGGIEDLFNRTFPEYPNWPGFYTWATNFAPGKPLMLGEWGVAEQPGNPAAKAALFTQLGEQTRYWPAIKALVYWNSSVGRTVGVTRVDTSAASLTAYRRTGMLPYFNP